MDPRRPEAYFHLGECFERSFNYGDCVDYYETAAEKSAIALLMHRSGDTILEGGKVQEMKTLWATALCGVIRCYLGGNYTNRGVSRKAWFCEASSLQRISRYVMDILEQDGVTSPGSPYTYAVIARAFSLVGASGDGVIKQGVQGLQGEEDLKEAARMFFLASKIPDQDRADDMLNEATRLLEWLRQPGDFDEIEYRHMAAGRWIIVRDPAEAESNGKLGRITNDERLEGQIPVQVGGGGNEPTFVNPQHLCDVNWPDWTFALVACLQEQSQWAYMRSKFELDGIC
ncbi:MAG: hypothetical protein SGARI_004709 [Bacillariaceae sp.]